MEITVETDMILNIIAEMYVVRDGGPKSCVADPVRWTRRDGNKEADFLANEAMDTRSNFNYRATGLNIDWKLANIFAHIDSG
eukprot:3999063-Karenia_brevis.AAC.1